MAALDTAADPARSWPESSTDDSSGAPLLHQLGKILLGGEYTGPGIALLLEDTGHRPQGEIGGVDPLQLVPIQRHGDGAERVPARAQYGGQRFAPGALVVVEEDLSGPALHRPLQGHFPRPRLQRVSADRFRDAADGVVIELPENRQIEMQPGAARGLHEDLQSQAAQQLVQPQGEIAGALERLPM